jgi:hypothetical protein
VIISGLKKCSPSGAGDPSFNESGIVPGLLDSSFAVLPEVPPLKTGMTTAIKRPETIFVNFAACMMPVSVFIFRITIMYILLFSFFQTIPNHLFGN